MEISENLICSSCGEPFKGIKTKNRGSICSKCFMAELKKKRTKWIEAHTKDKSLEEVIEWLLGFIYDNLENIEKVDMQRPLE